MRQLNGILSALLLFPLVLPAVETRDAIARQPTPAPQATCGSVMACSAVTAITTCDCRYDFSLNRILARATLRLLGTIYYFHGPFASIVERPRDRSVVDRESAIHHEYAYHITPAVGSVAGMLTRFETRSFPSVAECVVAAGELAESVRLAFQQTLAETQRRERH